MHVDIFKSRTVFLKPTTAGRETLYTCPLNNTGYLTVLILTNSGTGSEDMLVEYYDSSATTYHTLFHETITLKHSVIFDVVSEITLEAGDALVLTTALSNNITCIATIREYFDPARNT